MGGTPICQYHTTPHPVGLHHFMVKITEFNDFKRVPEFVFQEFFQSIKNGEEEKVEEMLSRCQKLVRSSDPDPKVDILTNCLLLMFS